MLDSGSEIGAPAPDSGGSVMGAGGIGLRVDRATFFFAAGFFTAFVLAAGTDFAAAFFLAAGLVSFFLATFFAAFFDLPAGILGRVFFLAVLPLTALLFALVPDRFALLFFFAMIILLLAVLRLLTFESSPEKVCCHLCVTLESVASIA